MRYVGIDLHKRHLTVHILGPQGQTVLHHQVSTAWHDVRTFFLKIEQDSQADGGYVVVLENCGFHDWLVKHLQKAGGPQVLVITAPKPARQKTDKRDAKQLAEMLWVNRDRIAAGQKLLRVSVVYQPNEFEQHDRQLTHLRARRGRALTRVKNSIGGLLRRHNLEQDCPTKGLFTKAGLAWLAEVPLSELDRCQLDMLLDDYRHYEKQIQKLDDRIHKAAALRPQIPRLRTLACIGDYTALALLAHIGPIHRFKNPRSLANFFGLTPGCRDSGQTHRPGSITKAGHPFVRFLLAQTVLHALRRDPGLRAWYREIKRRRGSRIARVAVMRRLCEILWTMLTRQENYRPMARPAEASPRARASRAKRPAGAAPPVTAAASTLALPA